MDGLFVRTKRTWLAYLALGYYGYLLNALGPAMPYLRGDLHLSFAEGSLHTSAFALGMLAAGLLGDLATRRLSRRTVMAWGLGGMGAGSLLLVAGHAVVLTLTGALLMGGLGTLVLVLVPAVLADEHGTGRAVALSEANVLSSGLAMLATVLVGGLARTLLGWRGALLLGQLLLVPLALQLRGLTSPSHTGRNGEHPLRNSLPASYWIYWAALVCCVSLEFCMIFWSADFLHHVANVPQAPAAALVSVFLGAMLVGRIAGSRLARALPADRHTM